MKNVTAASVFAMKAKARPIAMVTAYDATFAALFERAGVDILLVGDSLGMVVQGHQSTLPVTLDDVIYHTRAVVRGTRRAHVVADMPFMTYQADPTEGVRNAGRLVQEGGAHAVKLEGGQEICETVRRIVRSGIPVMGHVGLTPQSVHAMGGYRVQGKTPESAHQILGDSRALAEAGAYALVLEGVPAELAARITATVDMPTIGIGAGPECDGQVLVAYDLLGLNDGHRPRFVKAYAELAETVVKATERYCEEVRSRSFPAREHQYQADEPLFGPRSMEEDDGRDESPYGAVS